MSIYDLPVNTILFLKLPQKVIVSLIIVKYLILYNEDGTVKGYF